MISMTWPQYLRKECSYRGHPVALTKLQTEILSTMLIRANRITTAALFIDALWGDDPNGGPADAYNCFILIMRSLRRRLPSAIVGGRRGFGYYLKDAMA